MSTASWGDLGIEVPPGVHGEVDTYCPWCTPTRKKQRVKDLSINTDSGTYFCQHCGEKGRVDTGSLIPFIRQKKVYERPAPPPSHPKAEWPQEVVAFFRGRGISGETVRKRMVTFDHHYQPNLDQRVLSVAFPYYRDDVLINTKWRAVESKAFCMEKNAERILYGLDGITDIATFVEGEMDVLAMYEAGIDHAISVPDGAPPPDASSYASKFSFLESALPRLDALKRINIAVDADPPGERLGLELVRRLGAERCWKVRWPQGCKDANDVLMQHGPDALKACVDDAEPWPVAGIIHIRDLSDDVERIYLEGLPSGLSTGWDNLDQGYTVRESSLTVFTGIPSHGKSRFVDHLLVNIMELHDFPIAVCSPEYMPMEAHVAGMLAIRTNKPFWLGPNERMTQGEVRDAQRWLDGQCAFIMPEHPTVDEILERAKMLSVRMGIRGLVIDPWTELEDNRPGGMTESAFIGQSLTKVRNFGRNHGVHTWVIAHPTKMTKNTDGTYAIPTPYDISGSANWFNKADACLTIYRDKTDPLAPVQVHVQKMRFEEAGGLGVAEFHFDKATGRYIDAGWFAAGGTTA